MIFSGDRGGGEGEKKRDRSRQLRGVVGKLGVMLVRGLLGWCPSRACALDKKYLLWLSVHKPPFEFAV